MFNPVSYRNKIEAKKENADLFNKINGIKCIIFTFNAIILDGLTMQAI